MKPIIRVKNGTKKGYLDAYFYDGIDLQYPDSKDRRGRVQPQMAHTLTGGGFECVLVPYEETNERQDNT